MRQKTFNSEKTSLTEIDIDCIIRIVGYKCSEKTKARIRSILTYGPSTIGNYGIFDRLVKYGENNWQYIAGQSYPDEIRTLRELIIKG